MKLFQNFKKFLTFAVKRMKIAQLKSRLANSNVLNKCEAQTQKFALKNLPPYISFGYGVIMTLVFLIYEAQEFVEYSESFYPFVTSLLNLCNITVMIRNGPELFRLIDRLEKETEKRKFKKKILFIFINDRFWSSNIPNNFKWMKLKLLVALPF